MANNVGEPEATLEHSALADAIAQAKGVTAGMRKLHGLAG